MLASGIGNFGIAVAKISAEILKWRPFDIDIASFFLTIATYLYQFIYSKGHGLRELSLNLL